MKLCMFATTVIAVAAISITNSAAAADVGVSLSIGQPGFYGRIDIGDAYYPQPRIIYREPIVIERGSYDSPPIYLNVPPGHSRDWRKHCRHYNTCGERVYFVNNDWYNREYAPRYQSKHGKDHDDRGDRDGDRGNDQDGDRGNKHGKKDKDKDKGRGH